MGRQNGLGQAGWHAMGRLLGPASKNQERAGWAKPRERKWIWPKAKGRNRKALPISKPFTKIYLISNQDFNLE
jgi:hypothetical protein